VTLSLKARVLHLALVGEMIEPLRLLLEDVLTDSGLLYELTSQPRTCDLAIVMVNWGDERPVIAVARAALAGDTPLLAILPFGDDGLAQRALLSGAQGWFALDTPLPLLLAALLELTALGAPVVDDADAV